MNKHYIMIAGLLMLFLSGCGASNPGETPNPDMNFIVYSLNNHIVVSSVRFEAGSVAGAGSSVDSVKAKFSRIQLKKIDGSYVTVFSGSDYVETVGSSEGGITGKLACTKPTPGSYSGFIATVEGIMIKSKVNIGGTLYYTKTQSIDPGVVWQLSTLESDYGYVTYNTSSGQNITWLADFPATLEVVDRDPVNIVWMAEKDNSKIEYVGADQNSITWISAQSVVDAFLPYKPYRKVQFTLKALKSGSTTLYNTVTLFLDPNGDLLGAFCERPADKAINGNMLRSGSTSSIQYNGNKAAFDLKFADGDYPADPTKYYEVTGSYDCGLDGTSGSYTGLTVTGVNVTPFYVSEGGYSLVGGDTGVTSAVLLNKM